VNANFLSGINWFYVRLVCDHFDLINAKTIYSYSIAKITTFHTKILMKTFQSNIQNKDCNFIELKVIASLVRLK